MSGEHSSYEAKTHKVARPTEYLYHQVTTRTFTPMGNQDIHLHAHGHTINF